MSEKDKYGVKCGVSLERLTRELLKPYEMHIKEVEYGAPCENRIYHLEMKIVLKSNIQVPEVRNPRGIDIEIEGRHIVIGGDFWHGNFREVKNVLDKIFDK